jgi:ABC-type transport system involved in multi-copper enzyme maturation permease subunit
MNLVRAEFLKVRKRRGLVAATALLTIVPVLIGFAVLSYLHATNPADYDSAGGVDDLAGSVGLLTTIGVVAAIVIGATAGAGDIGAGVFRELVITGRSRLQLFAARIPGGLALLLPLVAAAFAFAAVASVVLNDAEEAPGAGLILRYGAWLALASVTAYLLALGVSSAIGSRSMSIGLLLGWQLAAAPILLASGKLDGVLPNAAIQRLDPGTDSGRPLSISFTSAFVVLAVWTLVPLVAGAWRTRTADA